MNKFFVVVIKNDSQSIIRHDTQDAALSAFHGEMAYAYNAQVDTTCIMTDMYGSQIKRERFEKPVPVEEVAEV